MPQDAIETLRERWGRLDLRQIAAWRQMSPARRLEIAFQAYQFALDVVRHTERKAHPDLLPQELAWRVTQWEQLDLQALRRNAQAAGTLDRLEEILGKARNQRNLT